MFFIRILFFKQLGFGKSMATNCVWCDGIELPSKKSATTARKLLSRQFTRYPGITQTYVDEILGKAIVYFDITENAQNAVLELRGRNIAGKKMQVG